MARLTNTAQAKKLFLSAFAKHGFIEKAAAYAGRSSRCTYYWRDETNCRYDPQFKAEFEEIKGLLIEKLEAEADRRGVEGVSQPVFYKGKIVGETREYSDKLLLLRLRGLDPGKYREERRTIQKAKVKTRLR